MSSLATADFAETEYGFPAKRSTAAFKPETQYESHENPGGGLRTPIWQTVKHLKATSCLNSPCSGYAMLRYDSVL